MESTAQVTSGAARDEFLTLLVSQLQHQDPLDPVPQHEFLGQLAQFSTLEGIENLNTTFSNTLKLQQLTQGANLVGQTAHFGSPTGDGSIVSGVIDAAKVIDGNLHLEVGGKDVPIDFVLGVSDTK